MGSRHQADMAKALLADYQKSQKGGRRCDRGKVIYELNTKKERECIDAITAALRARGATIHAYEHDGLCFTMKGSNVESLKRICAQASNHDVTVETASTFSGCVRALREKSRIEDWDTQDEDWEEREQLIVKARREPLESHELFAKIVLLEPKVSKELPYPLSELVVQIGEDANPTFFCGEKKRWCVNSRRAIGAIGGHVYTVLKRVVRQYKANRWVVGQLRPQVDLKPLEEMERFGNVSFRNHVAQAIIAKLSSPDEFQLDPPESLRYLNFMNGCWDRELDALVPSRPDMYIAHCTGWCYEEFKHPELDNLDRLFAAVRQEQGEGLSQVYTMSVEVEDEFRRIAATMPELQLFFDWVQDGATVIYLLQHISRAIFGIPMAEHLVIRSVGRGGKDTFVNLIGAVLGLYMHSISYDALCGMKDADRPTPQLVQLPGKRAMGVRECNDHKMVASVFKRICDPQSEMNARALYKDTIRFRPSSLPILCTNGAIELTKMDEACVARMAFVEFRMIWADSPQTASEGQCKELAPLFAKMRIGVFALSRLTYKHLMKNRYMRNVGPVPQACIDARRANIVNDQAERRLAVLLENIKPVGAPRLASSAAAVERALKILMAIEAVDVRTTLQGMGMALVQRKTKVDGKWATTYFYQFKFEGQTEPKWVALTNGEPSQSSQGGLFANADGL